MVEVTIVKAFTLTHNGTAKDEYFPVGVHDVPEEIASHWFVQAHTDNPPKAQPKPGTPEFAQAEAAAIARRKLVEAVVEQQAHEASTAIRNDARANGTLAEAEEAAHAAALEQGAVAEDQAAQGEAIRAGRRRPAPPV